MSTPSEIILDPRIAPPEPFKAIIFDCDGTLADTMPNHYVAWLNTVRAHGGEFPEELFYKLGGVPTRDIVGLLNERFGYSLDIEKVYKEKEAHYLTLMASVREIVAITDVARKYSGTVPLAVASGGTDDIVHMTLNAIGISPLFQAIVTADDVINGKPSPDMFLLAAERLGVAPEECVVYEDGEPGIKGAYAAGMRVVDVRVLWPKTRNRD